ncbi:FAD-binding oxidoreductase [Reyranella sp. CPCC 100927]|uniref:NAD(P)/FAD-dependent oxidoreductase n=1 Tax=Reyranella sp. CPCC 100927 TaxID=2599616 RepID=UPI0011B527C9|nr:FAD-binding oxidoreductase [Reyranella sp. CPCC 100927]TWT10133.1 FAD-binding oxidoreductase [Reyranella sp. CPCC 100927]
MSITEVEFAIVGAGIAGVSCAYFLAGAGTVAILEREHVAAYHTTGRSAALYSETYGNDAIRAITVASGSFYRQPPAGFADVPLLSPRGVLFIGTAAENDALDQAYREFHSLVSTVRRADKTEALGLLPLLNPDMVDSGVYEPDAEDMDVAAIHGGFLKGARAKGAVLRLKAEIVGVARKGGKWQLDLRGGDQVIATSVINAAGAWCDELAALAGVRPVGLVPKRRTAFTFDAPQGVDIHGLPAVVDIGETFYFKPEVGQFLGSPADETPSPPCDAQPEEIDIAIAVERIEAASTLRITRIKNKWAGLRSFVADKTFVVGYDSDAEGFFWLAGQGGYGIQSAPAMGRISAALAAGKGMPDDIKALDVTEATLSPARLR